MDKSHLDTGSASAPQSKNSDPEASLAADNYAAYSKSNADQAAQSRGVRKLILCFDGTGNKFHGDDSDSNILKIFRMLDRTADDQYHYYQPGIGTYVVSGSLSHTSVRARISSWYSKAKDSAIGSSFDQHVVGGYRFLMRFYNPGDEIYMFGFSRGAYIARFLAEMLDYIGLLSHGNEEMVRFAWKAFSQWQCRQQSVGTDEEIAAANESKRKMFAFMKGFRETFSRPVGRIKFLGLFDTVNSVPRFETAWMQRSKFPYTARSSAKVIRHAVSIDERRAKFRQDLMYQGNPKVKDHQHRHLGHWFGREYWNMQKNIIPDKEKTEEEIEERREEHEKEAEGLAPNQALSADEKSKEQLQTNGTQAGTSKERGRSPSQYLTPSSQPQRRRSDATSRPSQPQKKDSEAEFQPYRARSASRRRPQSQVRQPQKQPQDPKTHHSDAVSEFSGVDPSDVDPDWDDDGQDIDEVWFAGGHGDVGGGWEVLDDRKSASHVPLAWIVREAMRAGLPFDAEKVADMGCAVGSDWDGINPSRRPTKMKQQAREQKKQDKAKRKEAKANVPDIRMNDGATPSYAESPPLSPPALARASSSSSSSDDELDEHEHHFHGLMNKANTARIHDSLSYDSGLGFFAVSAWKFMEYLPFRRMDLKSDGSWEPISWPLPRGEVRDVPDNVRVHGSVIRRMEQDPNYRPGNLIIGGGGRGVRKAPEKYGIGDWVCVADRGDPIGEIFVREDPPPETEAKNGHGKK